MVSFARQFKEIKGRHLFKVRHRDYLKVMEKVKVKKKDNFESEAT